jgi:hypothetical protein
MAHLLLLLALLVLLARNSCRCVAPSLSAGGGRASVELYRAAHTAQVLKERNFPYKSIKLLASAR